MEGTTKHTVKLFGATLSYPKLATPEIKNGREVRSAVLLFDKSADLTQLRAALEAYTKEFFGGKVPGGLKSPVKDGDEKADEWGESFRNKWYFRASSGFPVLCVGADALNTPNDEIEDTFYAGCKVNVIVTPWGYKRDGNQGVSLNLNGLQFVADGDRLGGGNPAVGMFEPLEGSKPANNFGF